MMKFKNRVMVIEAEQFTDENKDRCFNFVRCNCMADRDGNGKPILRIQTIAGEIIVTFGDWIIKTMKGDFKSCKPDIFAETYEAVEDIANAQISSNIPSAESKARIVERTAPDGCKTYVIQKRHWLFSWWWCDIWMESWSGVVYVESYSTLEEAQRHLCWFDGTPYTDRVMPNSKKYQ